MDSPTIQILPLVNMHCATGENPVWVHEQRCVFWTDIPAGAIYRYDTVGSSTCTVYKDQPVGGFVRQFDGSWLLFRSRDIARMTDDGVVRSVLGFDDPLSRRFNDVQPDRQGRIYAGTIGVDEQSGGLYRLDPDRSLHLLFRGTGVANGMDFSPDDEVFYWTCTTTRTIFRFRYHSQTGQLTDRAVFHVADDQIGKPDGLVVDGEGFVWSARNGTGLITRHDPRNGEVVFTVKLPVPRVTSLCFGGQDLDRFYVTTGGAARPGALPEEGTLYELRGIGVRGREVPRPQIAGA